MPSFVDTTKNEVPGAALELCQLKIKQFSLGILKFRTSHEDNPFTLNCYMVPRTFLGSDNFRNSIYKETSTGSACVSRLSFRFLWLWSDLAKKNDLANFKSDLYKSNIDKLKNVRNNFSNLKSKVDKLDANKLVTVPAYLSKLSDVVKINVVETGVDNWRSKIRITSKILKIKYLILLT